MKILVSDPLSPPGIELLQRHARVELRPNLSPAELQEIIAEYDALIVRSHTRVTGSVINAGRQLKVIGRAGVGVDNIDLAQATARGITVLNVPEANTISAAELTLALLASLARNIPGANAAVKAGKWDRPKFLGVELNQKTLGLIGLGHVGSEVGRRAQALGMRVLAYDPYISEGYAAKTGVEPVEFPSLLEQADFISLHVPLGPTTRHLIGADELAQMKPGAMVINCARGGVVDEGALYDALCAGKIAGAALDVFEQEPPVDNPLLQLEQVITTPHLGALTREAQASVALQVAEQVLNALQGRPVTSAVNLPALMPETASALEPFLPLAGLLGYFYMQTYGGSIDEIEITYCGELASLPLSSLTASCLTGLLREVVEGPVNQVNAPYIARQRGIKIKEISTQSVKNYRNKIILAVRDGQKTYRLAGTLLNRNDLRIVQIGDFRIEVVPTRYMLMTTHHDRPGVIGRLGTLLGEEQINIASMQLGRSSIGGQAIAVLQVDSPVSATVVKKLEQLNVVSRARFIELPNLPERAGS